MPIHELKEQIARLPEQPGVYLYFNAEGDTIYVGKARALRDRVRNYLGAYGIGSEDRRAARRGRPPRGDRHRLGGRGARAREQSDQAAHAEVQHPAARRQELPVPAADHQRGVSARAGGARRPARRQLLRRPVHAGPFRAQDDVADAPAVRDALVQRGDHRQARPPLPRVRHQALHRAVRRHDLLARRSTAAPSRPRGCSSKGKNDELVKTLRSRMLDAAGARALRGGGAAARRAAHGADAARSPAEDGDRRARASRRLRPEARAGRRRHPGLPGPQRPGRRARRARHRGGDRRRRAKADVLEAAIQQFYELRGAPAEIYVPAEPADRDELETWLSERVGRKVRIVVPQRGEKRGFVDLANRNAALAYQTRFNQAQTAQYDALETLQHVLALPALPRRIECFDISTIQGSETVASMVVCEDGRMRRSEYRKFRIRGLGLAAWGSSEAAGSRRLAPSPQPQSPSARRLRGDARGRAAPLPQAARARRTVSRSGADRRRQGTALGGVRGARGARAREPRRGRHREEGGADLYARARRSDRAGRRTIRRCS